MRAAAGSLGAHLKRIPDGEVGTRANWIQFQLHTLASADGVELSAGHHTTGEPVHTRPLRLTAGSDAAMVRFPPLGYADGALESYGTFRRLIDAGSIDGLTLVTGGLATTPYTVTGRGGKRWEG